MSEERDKTERDEMQGLGMLHWTFIRINERHPEGRSMQPAGSKMLYRYLGTAVERNHETSAY